MNQVAVSDTQIQAALNAFLAKQLGAGDPKYKAIPGGPQAPYMFGAGGLFSVPGSEQSIISTRLSPKGIADVLPSRGSNRTDPLYPYITGFLGGSGSNPSGVCDDPMTAGPIKNCYQTAQFGRYSYQTRTFELNRLGQQSTRGEFQDLMLFNSPFAQFNSNTSPASAAAVNNFLNEVMIRFMEVGIMFQNTLTRQVYTGNPANNTAGGGYEEFPGLDILIGETKVDAKTGTPCPTLRSIIMDYNYNQVTSSHAGGVVNAVTYILRSLKYNAQRMNFGETKWALSMREGLFYELTAIWPCSYLTYRCSTGLVANQNIEVVNAKDAIDMRDQMRQGKYLVVDGETVPVITDDGIVEDTQTTSNRLVSGQFASDIYFIPLTVMGGTAVTFWEYFDYSGPNAAMDAISQLSSFVTESTFWSDGGRFLWGRKPMNNWCLQFLSKTEPRLILLTPHLAARLLNVAYTPLLHTRDALLGDPYFVDGGVTSRGAASDYSDWASTTPGLNG